MGELNNMINGAFYLDLKLFYFTFVLINPLNTRILVKEKNYNKCREMSTDVMWTIESQAHLLELRISH